MSAKLKLSTLVLACILCATLDGTHEAEPVKQAVIPPVELSISSPSTVTAYKQMSIPESIPAEPKSAYNVPLDEDVLEFLLAECEKKDVPPDLVIAIIEAESNFETDAISPTNDYGLMQINQINHTWLEEELGITDFLDPKQNIRAGVFILSDLYGRYGNLEATLMAYNLGPSGAAGQWAQGITSTAYTRKILEAMENLESLQTESG